MKYSILFAISFMLSTNINAQWSTQIIEDIMTNDKLVYATSFETKPLKSLEFPYEDLTASIIYTCNASNENVSIHFNKTVNLKFDVVRDSRRTYYPRIKWDDDLKDAVLTRYGSNNEVLDFYDDSAVTADLREYTKVLLELEWNDLPSPTYFEFDLNGSSKSIDEVRTTSNCE